MRWQLYQTAGKIVHHAGQLYLKVARGAVALFESIQQPQRCWTLAVAGAPGASPPQAKATSADPAGGGFARLDAAQKAAQTPPPLDLMPL